MNIKAKGSPIVGNYTPWEEVPEGYVTKVVPADMLAIFPCRLSVLQVTNTKVWSEGLPFCKSYKLTGDYDIELYAPLCENQNPEDRYCEIWVPIEKVSDNYL